MGGILFQSGQQPLFLPQKIHDFRVGAIAQGAQKRRDEHLALPVDLHVQDLVGVGFIFQPGAPVGNDLGGKQVLAHLVDGLGKIYAGGTDQLADNDPLRTVDDKGTLLGHQGEVPHEYRLLLHLSRFFIYKAHGDSQWRGIVYIPFLALFHRVFGMLEVDLIVHEFEDELFGIVRDRRNVGEHLLKILLHKTPVGIFLYFDQVRHVEDFVDPGKAHTRLFAHLHLMHHRVHSLT